MPYNTEAERVHVRLACRVKARVHGVPSPPAIGHSLYLVLALRPA